MKSLYESSAYSVFNNFERISQVPRCSNHEEKISEFMYNFGQELGLETVKDEFGNVLITKEATPGYEDHEAVILQSHIDMVCEKTEDSNHDFTCDPIGLIVEDGFIHANNTTLGADDGIGVALAMAILEDKDIQHPKIEAIFTTTEETGMDGALGLSKDLLKGKNLINIDNEEDNMIIVGCAGGVGAVLEHKLDKKDAYAEVTNFQIKVAGLRGGHSGTMIGESRANAIKILNTILLKLKSVLKYSLAEINGGSKHNAIPSSAKAVIAVDNKDLELLDKEFNNIVIEINDKYLKREVDLELTLEKVEGNYTYIDDEVVKEILNSLEMFPHGVNTTDKELEIVRSSNNLAIVKTEGDVFKIQTSIRSSFGDDLEFLKNSVSNIADNFNYSIKFSDGYPMWVPNFDNHLLNVAKNSYKEIRNEEVEVAVIHAGLETGILSQKYPDMNMISMGPNIFDAHTPKEKLSVESTEFSFKLIKRIIKSL
ncbi:aminoacyl-histidine dipeptidase [Helcococcus kunzii]